jgi:20S proteasome subunit beta 6
MRFLLFFTLLLFEAAFAKFDPYISNGGTVVGLAGKDYVLFAADTRLSDKYAILTRNITRIFEIDDGLLYSGSDCWSDVVELSKELKRDATVYEWEHKMKLKLLPLSHLVSFKLYQRRGFPYYTFSMVGGIDTTGIRFSPQQ